MPQTQPLAVLTRPQGLNEALEQALVQAGWSVILAPALQITPRRLNQNECVPDPADFDLVVFVSANAVAGFASQLNGTVSWPTSTRAACVGVTTAQSVRNLFGDDIEVLHPAKDDSQDSESLWRVITALDEMPRRVLILRGQDGRDWLADQFLACGVFVQIHPVYCRELATWPAALQTQLCHWVSKDVPVVWLLTSPHGIDAVMGQIQRVGAADWALDCRYIVTHPRLVDPLLQHLGVRGKQTCIEISRSDLSSLVSCFDRIKQNLEQN